MDWLTDELHQEFLLRICEIGEDKLATAKEGGYLDWFCFDVINKIWGKRGRYKIHVDGSTSPLFQLSSGIGEIELGAEAVEVEDFDKHLLESRAIIEKDINSSDIYLNFKARVFAYSVGMRIDDGVVSFGGKFKSQRAFAKATGIPHSTSYNAFIEYKQILKTKLKI